MLADGPSVLCAMSCSGVRIRVARLVEQAGGVPDPAPAELRWRAGARALIHDLSPWDLSTARQIAALRTEAPDMPVLLYLPPTSRALSLIPECGSLVNTRVRMQDRSGEAMAELEDDIAWLLREIPLRDLGHRLLEAMGRPSRLGRSLAPIVLRAVATGRRITVDRAAASLGLARVTLERRARHDLRLRPKEFIDWVTMAYLAYRADRCGSLSCAARRLRRRPNDVYRMKQRLARRAGRPLDGPHGRLAATVEALSARCAAVGPPTEARALAVAGTVEAPQWATSA